VTYSVQESIQIDIAASNVVINRIEINQLLSLPFLSHLPTSGTTLHHCSTLRRRRRLRYRLPKFSIQQLETCSKDQRCSFVLLRSKNEQISKDFLVHFIETVQQAGFPIIWVLRFEDFWQTSLNSTDLLKLLVVHALQVNSNILQSTQYPLTAAALREAASERDWISILKRILQGLPLLYIVLDTDLVGHAMRHSSHAITNLLTLIVREISPTAVKVIISDTAIDERFTRDWDVFSWTRIKLDPDDLGKRRRVDSLRVQPQKRLKLRRRF
jgi:hypothetical protein